MNAPIISARGTKSTLRIKPKPAAAAPVPAPPRPPPAPIDADHFFTIWRTDGPRPKQRHLTLAAAATERERLQATSPGATFYIFECKRVPV
jgi:hypothetical protein